MSDKPENNLGTYGLWTEAFSAKSLERIFVDQARLQRGMLRHDTDCRVTPASPAKLAYDEIRATRDNQDYREWNEDTGFSGVNRWPAGPGMTGHGVETDGQQRRRAHLEQLDDGF